MHQRGPKPRQTPGGYVRFTDAIKLFMPLSRSAFSYRVKAGDITVKEDSTGRMYEVSSILQIKRDLLRAEERKKAIDTYTDWIKIEDVIAGLKLDRIVYNEIILADEDHYRERKKKNPHTSIGVFDVHDRDTMYAYISLLPLREETIMDILLGRRPETRITSKDILAYDEPGEYSLLVSSVVHHPDHPHLIRRLLNAFMDYWVEQYPDRRIKRIYAETVSEDGKRMANELRMSMMYRVVDERLERVENAFVLDMSEPAASKIIQKFQKRLKEKTV